MNYIHSVYSWFFVTGDAAAASTPRKIVAFGNVLLDRTTQLSDTTLLERFQLKPNSKGELDAETLAVIAAEASQFSSSKCEANPGGSALNTVRILKRLGTSALFFGAVGEDKPAEELKDILEQRGVEARLETVSGAPTGQCLCLIHEDSTALYANIGASAKLSIEHLKRAERDETQAFLRPIERRQILYIEGFFVPQRESVCDFIVQQYIRERRRLALNLSATYIVRQNYEQLLRLAQHAFFIFGNHKEFQAFSEQMGTDSVEDMARNLLQGPEAKVIVITKGAEGVQLISNFVEEQKGPGEVLFQCFMAPHVENVVDPTGAGDAFVAGFLHAWLEKRSLSECTRLAADVSAQVVTQIGCNMP